MTRFCRCHAIVWALMFLVLAVSPSAGTILTGSQLAQLMREFEKAQADFDSANSVQASGYLGYIMGVFDATENLYSAPATITSGRLGEIVASYLKRHAERWEESAAGLVIDALTAAFPKASDLSVSKGSPTTNVLR